MRLNFFVDSESTTTAIRLVSVSTAQEISAVLLIKTARDPKQTFTPTTTYV
jgi:hypothetical protein